MNKLEKKETELDLRELIEKRDRTKAELGLAEKELAARTKVLNEALSKHSAIVVTEFETDLQLAVAAAEAIRSKAASEIGEINGEVRTKLVNAYSEGIAIGSIRGKESQREVSVNGEFVKEGESARGMVLSKILEDSVVFTVSSPEYPTKIQLEFSSSPALDLFPPGTE